VTGNRTYYNDAVNALDYTKDNLTRNGILKAYRAGGDGGGFKGIFARWAAKFTRDNHITRYDSWFIKNAKTAWSHCNSRRVMEQDWSRQTGNGEVVAFDCSSAVVLMQSIAPDRKDRDFLRDEPLARPVARAVEAAAPAVEAVAPAARATAELEPKGPLHRPARAQLSTQPSTATPL
jgi:hypothetical protein